MALHMYSKEHIRGLLTVGLRDNFADFTKYCLEHNLSELARNKFIDLGFDLLVAMRDVPTVCPYVSYMRYKRLDFMQLLETPTIVIMPKPRPCGGCGGGKVL
jgi:hypothetical protein